MTHPKTQRKLGSIEVFIPLPSMDMGHLERIEAEEEPAGRGW